MDKKNPPFLKKYFWDVDYEKIDFSGRKVMIIKRIMEYGDSEAVSWMLENFSKEDMKEVLAGSRGLTKKSANYWAVFLEVDKEKVICLRRSSRPEQKASWPY